MALITFLLTWSKLHIALVSLMLGLLMLMSLILVPANIYLFKSTIETLEKVVKYV